MIIAQVPSYVPTNGLVGYWPFSGNANDISSNGNNGTVNGAILTTDRFGNSNSAYSFNGINNYVKVNNSNSINSENKTLSVWLKYNIEPTNLTNGAMSLISKWYQVTNCSSVNSDAFILNLGKSNNMTKIVAGTNVYSQSTLTANNGISLNNWIHVVFTHDISQGGKIYINGVFAGNINLTGSICFILMQCILVQTTIWEIYGDSLMDY